MPDTIVWEGIGGLVLCLAAAVLAIYFYGRYWREVGYEEGRDDQYAALGSLAEMAELADHETEPAGDYLGRHACTQPRTLPPAPAPAAQDRPPWITHIPGPARIQPGRTSGDGTVTFPRVQLTDASTGEIRAIGDANVAAIQAAALP